MAGSPKAIMARIRIGALAGQAQGPFGEDGALYLGGAATTPRGIFRGAS
jgi:hypothetical protein